MEFPTRKAAQDYLRSKGLEFNRKSPFADQDREYWWFTDKHNTMSDHSATITRIGRKFLVADYTRS